MVAHNPCSTVVKKITNQETFSIYWPSVRWGKPKCSHFCIGFSCCAQHPQCFWLMKCSRQLKHSKGLTWQLRGFQVKCWATNKYQWAAESQDQSLSLKHSNFSTDIDILTNQLALKKVQEMFHHITVVHQDFFFHNAAYMSPHSRQRKESMTDQCTGQKSATW